MTGLRAERSSSLELKQQQRADGMMDPPEFFLWTRVGKEAGESLDHILWRKDLERRLGVFCWGIGSAIKRDTLDELRYRTEIDLGMSEPAIIFSEIKGKPKQHDVNPSGVIAWRSYLDLDGETRALPDGVLVTSRQKQRAHYVLFCASAEPLTFADPVSAPVVRKEALRNIKPPWKSVGDSQNTVAVKFDPTLPGKQTYPVSYVAQLVDPYVAKLADPVLLSDLDCKAIAEITDEAAWFSLVADIRSRPPETRDEQEGTADAAVASSMREHASGGTFHVDQTTWGWAEQGANAEFWCAADEPQEPAAINYAARRARDEMSSDLLTPTARTVPSTYAIIGQIATLGDLLKPYDELLIQALRLLEVANAKSACDYGMPSEYRGWLAWARQNAMSFIHVEEGNEDQRDVAEEVVIGSSAVAFSMRFGHVTTPYTLAVAIKGLREALRSAGVSVD